MASGESSQQEGPSWLTPVRIVKSAVTSSASTLYQAMGFGQVGMNVDSDWVTCAVKYRVVTFIAND